VRNSLYYHRTTALAQKKKELFYDMMDYYQKRNKLKLGFAPTRRTTGGEKFFSKAEAYEHKNSIEAKLKSYGIDYVNLDFLNEEGLIYDPNPAIIEQVAEKFIAAKVDAIFVPHSANTHC
jgi:hypothetical protein